MTPVPRVYLSIALTTPGPSGSFRPARLRRGCSHPPRRSPDQAASSFAAPLRRHGHGRSFTPIRHMPAPRGAIDVLPDPLVGVELWGVGGQHEQLEPAL